MHLIKCLLPVILVFLLILPLGAESLPRPDPANASFNNNFLVIPSVDTDDQVGQYQNIIFELTDKGNWLLRKGYETQANTYIGTARVMLSDSFPVQVFLQVSGWLIGCGGLGEINQRWGDGLVEVLINEGLTPDGMLCTADLKPFDTVIAIPVYGFSAGTYSYHVHGQNMSGEFGTFTGTFELTEDNSLPMVGL